MNARATTAEPAPARPGQLDLVVDSLPPGEAESVRAWLGTGGKLNPRALLRHHEPVASRLRPPAEGDAEDTAAIRSVGIIGGGTAGYFTALALRAWRPWLDVTVVESSDIPVIGVGEATVPNMVTFLHNYLSIDPAEFYERVKPTWKLGIKFDWGPDPAGFMAPFDWGSHSVGALGSLTEQGNINAFTVESLLMMADLTPVLMIDGQPVSLLKYLPFAYHMDNARLVSYLTDLARRRGVQHVDAKVAEVLRSGDDWVDCLQAADGRKLRFDFYVDCTGFRSRLLGQALGTPFESYASTLHTDSAVTGNRAHNGHLKPYTTATTMDSGWCWTIPTPENDHLGYVFCSAAVSDQDAAAELAGRFPGVDEPRYVRFRSGRHREAWRGNVMAIGNSYAFVEPLESTALLMVTLEVETLVSAMPVSWAGPASRHLVNNLLAEKWDALRWFLGIHYRFNQRLDTPFWKEARCQTDVSGWQPLLDMYAEGAPLTRREPLLRQAAQDAVAFGYGLAGVDNILLGQRVPARLLTPAETPAQWRQRRAAAAALIAQATPQHTALPLVTAHPEPLEQLFHDRDSWAFDRGLAAAAGDR